MLSVRRRLEPFGKNADLDDRKSLSQMWKITAINGSPEWMKFWHEFWPVHMQDKKWGVGGVVRGKGKGLLSDKFFKNAFVTSLASLPNGEDALKLFCG